MAASATGCCAVLLMAPLIKLVDYRLAVAQSVLAQRIVFEFFVRRFSFKPVELTDQADRLCSGLRLIVLGFDKLAPGMRPTLGVSQTPALLGVACVSGIAVTEQRALELAF